MSMGQPVAAISDRAPATFLMEFALSLSQIAALFKATNSNVAC
jgi:hypothetical protein